MNFNLFWWGRRHHLCRSSALDAGWGLRSLQFRHLSHSRRKPANITIIIVIPPKHRYDDDVEVCYQHSHGTTTVSAPPTRQNRYPKWESMRDDLHYIKFRRLSKSFVVACLCTTSLKCTYKQKLSTSGAKKKGPEQQNETYCSMNSDFPNVKNRSENLKFKLLLTASREIYVLLDIIRVAAGSSLRANSTVT